MSDWVYKKGGAHIRCNVHGWEALEAEVPVAGQDQPMLSNMEEERS